MVTVATPHTGKEKEKQNKNTACFLSSSSDYMVIPFVLLLAARFAFLSADACFPLSHSSFFLSLLSEFTFSSSNNMHVSLFHLA